MPHPEDRKHHTTELHHHDELVMVAGAWTGMTLREMPEITPDLPHLNLKDEENDPTRTPGLPHAPLRDVVAHLLEVPLVDEEGVRATAPTAVTAEVALPQEVAAPVERAMAVGGSFWNNRAWAETAQA